MGAELIEYEMLPQGSSIIIANLRPTSLVGYEAGIEAIDLWRRDNFFGLVLKEGFENEKDVSFLKYLQIVGQCGPTHSNRAG